MCPISVILLAAGNSSRLGRPKQLLEFQGRTLVRRAAEAAVESVCAPVIVVTGAYESEITAKLADLPLTFAQNPDWQSGIGSSIKTGVEKLPKETNAVLIMPSDQPFLSTSFINELALMFSMKGCIAASTYEKTLGIPAIFSREYFHELASLPSQQGAKCLIEKHWSFVRAMEFPQGALDIDTEADYQELLATPVSAE